MTATAATTAAASTPNPYLGLAGIGLEAAGSFYSTYQASKAAQKQAAEQSRQFNAQMAHNSRAQDFEEKQGIAKMTNDRKQVEQAIAIDNIKAIEMLSESNRTQNHVLSMFKAFNSGTLKVA